MPDSCRFHTDNNHENNVAEDPGEACVEACPTTEYTDDAQEEGNAPGTSDPKLQAPVYDILPSTIAVFSYAIGSRKLSANEQFFIGAQTLVSLLQTTQIKQGVSFR